MARNLPLITLAAIFAAGLVLVGMAFVYPLGFSDQQIIPYPSVASHSEMKIVIDKNALQYFAERNAEKSVETY